MKHQFQLRSYFTENFLRIFPSLFGSAHPARSTSKIILRDFQHELPTFRLAALRREKILPVRALPELSSRAFLRSKTEINDHGLFCLIKTVITDVNT